MPSSLTTSIIAAAQRTLSGGSVERGEEPVAGGVDLPTPEPGQLRSDPIVVAVDELR